MGRQTTSANDLKKEAKCICGLSIGEIGPGRQIKSLADPVLDGLTDDLFMQLVRLTRQLGIGLRAAP
jgi:hypothetical protein